MYSLGEGEAKPVTDLKEGARTEDIHENSSHRPLDNSKGSDESPAEESAQVSPPQPRPRSALELARQVLFHQQSLRFPPPRL